MKKSKLIFGLALMTGVLIFSGCTSSKQVSNPLKTVASLDLGKYSGQWYEIARYQHQFEKRLVGTTAEYTIREDGKIGVKNSGYRDTLDGAYKVANAVAWRPDDAVPGALKVKFFNLFTSDYLVFGLDEDNYQWALVGNDSRKYLWFLSRSPEVPAGLLDEMKAIAQEQGYDLTDLFMVPQKAQ